ncbi:MAG: hypothetical protein C4521_00705 [Actinobacteria bacterium]|nr:MAG: hypothetical protein C4521_00705 [Actinomycetota bacterium]
MPARLIRNFTVTVATPECYPTATTYRACLQIEEDIAEVLPYLNAALPGASYERAAQVVLWTNQGRKYAFRAGEIAIAPVESREEAETVAEEIVARVNDVWSRRGEIEPSFEGKKALPAPLDILKLLPKTNCGECGLTCLAFASALREDRDKLSLCPYLSEEDYASLVQ